MLILVSFGSGSWCIINYEGARKFGFTLKFSDISGDTRCGLSSWKLSSTENIYESSLSISTGSHNHTLYWLIFDGKFLWVMPISKVYWGCLNFHIVEFMFKLDPFFGCKNLLNKIIFLLQECSSD
jgi:hypothetical protein